MLAFWVNVGYEITKDSMKVTMSKHVRVMETLLPAGSIQTTEYVAMVI